MYKSYGVMYDTCRSNKSAKTDSRRFLGVSNGTYKAPPMASIYQVRNMPVDGVFDISSQLRHDNTYEFRYDDLHPGRDDLNDDLKVKGKGGANTCACSPAKDTKESFCASEGCMSSSSSLGSRDGKEDNLLPILDPRFNLREASKHMILLEDHMFQKGRRCKDCISKHFSTAEAFLDEAITLDKEMKYYQMITDSQGKLRVIIGKYKRMMVNNNLSDQDYCNLAQEVRTLRKPICQQFSCFV